MKNKIQKSVLMAIVAPVLMCAESAWASEIELRTATGVLSFASAEKGFGCEGLHYGQTTFMSKSGKVPGLWTLRFAAGTAGELKELDAANCGGKRSFERVSDEKLRFLWREVDIVPGDKAVDVDCDVAWNESEGRFEFNIRLVNRSKTFGLFSTDYPRFAQVVEKGRGNVIHPGGNWGATRKREIKEPTRLAYPDFDVPIQFAAFEADTGDGVMVAALDDAACTKYLAFGTDNSFNFSITAENAGIPGNAKTFSYPIALYPFHGNWWRAAKLYRAWAVGNASWMKKGPLARRKDIPKRIHDAGLWMCMHTFDEKGSDQLIEEHHLNELLKRLDGKVALSTEWYGWHKHPQDVLNPEFLPARPNFADVVRRLTRKGVLILPYVNGRIWDHGHAEFEAAKPFACRKRDGSLCVEDWGGRKFSAMCQSTEFWRKKFGSIVDGMVDDIGVNGAYIDQIASMEMVECFSPDHGHPVGGGSHWVDDYKLMIRDLHSKHPGVSLTSENFSEPYVDAFDGFELWCPNSEEDLPMIPAVYSGYAIFYGGQTSSSYTLDAFRATQGRNFLWGEQTGYTDAWVLKDENKEKLDFLIRLAEVREANAEFLIDGELMGEVGNRADAGVLDVVWKVWGVETHVKLPPVMATRWRSLDGKELIAVANLSNCPAPFDGGRKDLVFTLGAGEVRVVK